MPPAIFHVTVPKNTPKDNPIEQDFELEGRLLYRYQVIFPDGCAQLVGVQLFYGEDQILPTNRGEWLTGNNEIFNDDIYWELPEGKIKLKAYLYNEDEIFDHTITFRFFVIKEKYHKPYYDIIKLLYLIFRKLDEAFGGEVKISPPKVE